MKMRWSLYLGKIAGIKLFVHWTFLILVFWIIQMHVRAGYSTKEILLALAFLVALFVCVILHELGHALTAKRYLINTSSINILPIGGVALLEGLPEKPSQELAVALAGPLVNVVIAGILFVILYLTGNWPGSIDQIEFGKGAFWVNLYTINLFLALFNLIPAFPMDGGRILRAALSFKLDRVKATRIAANLGQILAIAFVIFGFYSNPMLIFIGFFVFLGAQAEMAAVQMKYTLKGIKVSDVVMRHYTSLKPDEPVSHAVSVLLNSQEKAFIIMDNDEVKGSLSWKEVVSGLSKYNSDTLIDQIMNKEIIAINADEPLQDAIEKMQHAGDALFPVYSQKELVGVVNMENVTEFLAVQNALRHRIDGDN